MNKWILAVLPLAGIALPLSTALASSGGTADEINDPRVGWNHLWREQLIDITVIGVIFSIVALYFMIRFRRKDPNQEGRPVKLSKGAMFGWALIPAFLFMADDFYLAAKGWSLWNDYRTVPEDRYEIRLESAMWSWNFTYPEGVETTNELVVPEGKPILLRMTSRDVVHALSLPYFRVKEDSMPGRLTYLWFYPKKAGEYVMTCTEFCGVLHSKMTGTLKVLPKEEFDSWLSKRETTLKGGV